MPKEKSVASLGIARFNASATLLQLCQVLSRVAKGLRHVYQASSNTTVRGLGEAYLAIEKELNSLAKLVEKQLSQYSKPIIHNTAIISDDWVSYMLCQALVAVLCALIGYVAKAVYV
jgi:hypothetical protein